MDEALEILERVHKCEHIQQVDLVKLAQAGGATQKKRRLRALIQEAEEKFEAVMRLHFSEVME